MKKTQAIIGLLISCNYLFAQWQLIPGGEGSMQNIELSNSYLYVAEADEDSAFTRIDLRNFTKVLMRKPNGFPFSRYGWKEIAASGEHVMYTDKDTFFVSHDYGVNWAKSSLLPETGMYFLMHRDTFLMGGYKKLMISTDKAYTFSQLYYESYYLSGLKPLLVKDSKVFFRGERGLVSVNLDGSADTDLSPASDFLYGMVNFGDTLIASGNGSIYRSLNGGYAWTSLNSYPFTLSSFIYDLFTDGTALYAATQDFGIHISFDQGETFLPINEGLPPNTSVLRIKMDNMNFYIATTSGVYYRPRIDFRPVHIWGNVYYDKNENGVRDLGETGLNAQSLKLKSRNFYFYTDTLGNYSFTFPGSSDTVLYLPPFPYFIASPPNYYAGSVQQTGNFAVQIDSTIENLGVLITPLTNSRPGFQTVFAVDCNNYGSGTATVQIHVTLDTLLSMVALSDSGTVVNNEITWSKTLAPFESIHLTARCSLPPDVNLMGDTLVMIASVAPGLNDYDATDNTDTFRQEITNSYDPNDKNVIPESDIHPSFLAEGKELQYFVRFQNTGNDTAFSVRIDDNISEHLDPGTFRFIGASHRCNFEIDTFNKISFYFKNILLPDSSTDEQGSHGYVRFKIKPKSTIAPGTEIENTAHIFFDFNPAVITNTVVTTYDIADGIEESSVIQSERLLFPNPTTGDLWLEISKDERAQLFSMLGQQVQFSSARENGLLRLNLKMLQEGIYFLHVVSPLGAKSYKILKSN